MKSYYLQVKSITREIQDAVTISFWHPINEQIKYKAGQFITISIPDSEGKKIKRSYSMSSSPHTDTAVAVTVKRVENGIVSNYLNDNVKVGDFLEVIEPMGNFYYEPTENPANTIVLVAAGSGITPLMSIAKSVLKTSDDKKVYLYYGNRNNDTTVFLKELLVLEQSYKDRFKVVHIQSKPSTSYIGHTGRINQANAILVFKEWGLDIAKATYYLCGPIPMMEEIKKVCTIYDVPKENFHIEKFNAPAVFEELNVESSNALVKQDITIHYEGSTYNLVVEPHQTILEAALELDIDLPYSCQAGMCTACMGKCTSGKVIMDEDDGLTEKEIKEGYVLTCVAHPVGSGVVLEFE